MSGEKDLGRLLSTMRPALLPGEFVFAILPHGRDIPQGVQPVMSFCEAEGTTLILPAGSAEAAGLSPTFPSRMITLQVHPSPEEVGFLAFYLCSDEAGFLTGCDYPIDGGFIKLNN